MLEELKNKIRDIPDFPKKGIIFKDLTTLFNDASAFSTAIDFMRNRYIDKKIDTVVGIEARGFVIGSALAYALNAGFALIRKPGKLPYDTYSVEYELEYGKDSIEIHKDAIIKGNRIIIADDLLATGGTVSAACELVKKLDVEIIELTFLVELTFLNGRGRLSDYTVSSLLKY